MIQNPTPRAALSKLKKAAKTAAKSGIRIGVALLGKSPALKKLLVRAIRRVPALDRRMRTAMSPFENAEARRASSPADLSPAAQAMLRRLRPDANKKA